MTSPTNDTDLLSMLDSIEEAIGSDSGWSEVPPPVEIVVDDAHAPARSGERARAAFEGISAELRKYPDAPPRPAGTGPRRRGPTSAVLATFKWGGG